MMNVNNISTPIAVMKQSKINNKNVEEVSTVENKSKVELIKEEIKAGIYKVDINKIANSIANDLL